MSDLRRYTPTGGPVPGNVRASMPPSPVDSHRSQFAVRRGFVQRAVPKGDPENLSGRLEYVVLIDGHLYKGVIDATTTGGVYNYRERVRTGVSLAFAGPLGEETFPEETDGEAVWCLMVKGDGDRPLIIAGDIHPRLADNKDYAAPSILDGVQDVWEFNGFKFKIDKLGALTVEMVGHKEQNTGAPINPTSIGTKFSIDPLGSLSFLNALGTKLEISNVDGSILAETPIGDKVLISPLEGVQIEVPTGAKGSFKNGEVYFEAPLGETALISPNQGIQLQTTIAGGTNVSMKSGKLNLRGAVEATIEDGFGAKMILANGEITAEDILGGKLKLAAGKVGLGGPAGEVIEQLETFLTHMETQCDMLNTLATSMATETHTGNLGYPTSPPLNAAIYTGFATNITALKAQLTIVKAIITALKGGI